jgi:hypothetical protein
MTPDAWSQTSGSRPGRGQANAIGLVPSNLRLPPPHDDALPAVHHRQRDKPFDRKRFDIGPDGGEVVRVADRHCGNTLPPRLLPQQRRAYPQGRLREAVRRLGRHQPGSRVGDDRDRPAVDPAAFQRRDVTRQPQQAMTGGAVALSRDDRFGNRTGVFRGDAVTKKNPDNQIRKFSDADGLWHRAILGSPLAGTTRGDTEPRRE